ncbi:histone deacetylase 14, chloroplastic-like [Rutidosis leptorrhynchoides]|uniref:histone deacetylase 14, chloroplastic-like n=1 Tax=Rutidosis leptorrhynchoides TaxID=125765 RepID=UPI003A997F49
MISCWKMLGEEKDEGESYEGGLRAWEGTPMPMEPSRKNGEEGIEGGPLGVVLYEAGHGHGHRCKSSLYFECHCPFSIFVEINEKGINSIQSLNLRKMSNRKSTANSDPNVNAVLTITNNLNYNQALELLDNLDELSDDEKVELIPRAPRRYLHRDPYRRFFLSLRTECCVASSKYATEKNEDGMPKVIYSLGPAMGHNQISCNHENNTRIRYILSALENAKLTPEFRGSEINQLQNNRKATLEDITSVHSTSYYSFIEKSVEDAKASADGLLEIEMSKFDPTYVTRTTLNDSLIAAGAGLSLVDAVVTSSRMSENPPVGFALIRPPGHHAFRGGAMGGCIFNNISIAARYAQRTHGLKRVFIIDFDAHHGNGTSDAFYDDPDVFFLSTHQDGIYPVDSGKFDDIGCGNGEGATLNLPLPEGSGDVAMQTVFDEVIVPCAQRFKPDIILVSAGYNGHIMDTSMWQMTTKMSYMLAYGIKELARDLCVGRCVFFLEGGWCTDSLKFCIEESFRAFIGEPSMPDECEEVFGSWLKDEPSSQIKQAIQRVKNSHSL